MTGRRLLALVGVVGLVLAALVLPAAAQVAPPNLTSISPTCGPLGQNFAVDVRGTYQPGFQGPLEVRSPAGTQVGEGSWSTARDGTLTGRAFFDTSANGYYGIRAFDPQFQQYSNTIYFSSPCRNPRVSLSPTCSTPGTAQTLTVTATDFAPNDLGSVFYDWNGQTAADSRLRIPIDGSGNFATTTSYKSTPFNVTAPNRSVPTQTRDNRGNVVDVAWSPCPPGPTTAPTTTAPPVIDTTTTTTAPTTTRPTVPGSLPTTTLPPTIDIPPPTPGATLVLDPPLGPTGFVAGAVGTGFPPGPVELTWSGGIGTTMAIAGPDGTFSTRVLVLPGDRLGPRAMVATGGGTSTFAAFLVVPSTVQPSGQDVLQINRIRRFNNR